MPRTVWLLRALVALGPLVALLAPLPQGYRPSVFVGVVVLVTGVAWAFAPDHLAGGLAMVIVLVWWTTSVGEALPFASVVAAAGFVVSHAAATVLGYGPARARLDPVLLLTWARRAAMVWTASLVIWLVADVYSGHPTPTSFWLLGLGAALVGALVAAFWVPMRVRERSGVAR